MDTGGLAAQLISIHALRKESDLRDHPPDHRHHISIHALRKESDCGFMSVSTCSHIFQSTLSVRRATGRCSHASRSWRDFNPRSP